MQRAYGMSIASLLVLSFCGCGETEGWPDLPPYEAPSVEEVVAELEDLTLDGFFEASYRHILRRYPETLTSLGIAELYGLRNDHLNNISDAYIRETYALLEAILDLLHARDRASLSTEQQLSYDVYEWVLRDWLQEKQFIYYDYPVSQMTGAVHNWLILFLTDIHPVSNKRDAEDYVTRLWRVDAKLRQLIDGLDRREAAGVVPPRFILQWTLYTMRDLVNAEPRGHVLYTTFEEKLAGLAGMDRAERDSLLRDAERAIRGSVLPAYRELASRLERLESSAPTHDGVWQFDDGPAYYGYTLAHHTTTELTADDIHRLGIEEVSRIRAEMRGLFDALGYPPDESLSELFARVADDGGSVAGNRVLETYEAIIDRAERNLDAAFAIRPPTDVVVIGHSTGGFYVSGSLDGSRPGAFYANISGAEEPLYAMPSLTYHETVPGHHLQISIAQHLDLPDFRKDVGATAFVEGWALYAERLAAELGWYAEDLLGDLGRLQYEIFRAARLVVDTGIHAKHWTFNQAHDYMVTNVGFDPQIVNLEYQVGRYIAWPGQATAYKVGMRKILELRKQAMDRLGDRFDLKKFHSVLLTNGELPLSILERVVQAYIAAELSSG